MTYLDNTPTDSDAEILRLEHEYDATRAACMPGGADVDERIAERYRIAEEIENMPARTAVGHAVKLRVWLDILAVAFSDDAPVSFEKMVRSVEAIRTAMTAA